MTNTVLERLDCGNKRAHGSSDSHEMVPLTGAPKSQVILERGEESRICFQHDDTIEFYDSLAEDFEEDLTHRPTSWWICWACGGIFVSASVFMAIMVSFNTPTIGLGCRSLTWLMFWLLSSISWFCQALFQEPPRFVRYVSISFNTVAFFMLLVIMLAHVYS